MATATLNESEQRGGGRGHREGDAPGVGGSGTGVQFQRGIEFQGRPREKFQVYFCKVKDLSDTRYPTLIVQ